MRRSRQTFLGVAMAMLAAGWACTGAGKTAPPSPAAAASPAPPATMMSPGMPMEGMMASPGASPAMGMGMERDPVCGMEVDPKTAPKSTHQGKTYYFCSTADKDTFDKEPQKYVKKP